MQQRGVVLVEGTSDRRALETLARRRGRDLQSEGVAVVAMGGYGNLPRLLGQYGGVRLAGLYDVGEERHFLRALGCVDRGELERVGFYACTRDLEDELTRAVGPAEMERVLAEQGELRAFRTYQRQPAHRARPLEEQLHGFMWNRKQRYAVLLVEALDLERIPRPLDRVLACVQLDTARSRTVLDVEAGAWEAGAGAWIARVGASRGEMHDASVRDLLPPPAGLTLDVGCGEGRLTRELASLGYEVVGVDRSAALVEAARQADPSGRYEVAAIDALPIEDGEAQLVLCINVLPHVVDLVGAARELARVLPAGGVLVAGHRHPVAEAATYDEENDELRVRGYFEHEPHAVSLGDGQVFHQHRTIEDYVRTLIGAGFALEDLREVPRAGGSTPAYLDLRLTRH